MKFIHLADLHLGKIVNEFSMLEDQRYILEQILTIIKKEEVDGVIIAGDVYDRSIPPAEAVELLDYFITAIAKENRAVYLVGGNHDYGERLEFGRELLNKSKVHISGYLKETIDTILVEDEYGSLAITLLPFFKPAVVRQRDENRRGMTYEQAVKAVVEEMSIDKSIRNLLVTHHFVTHASTPVECSDSENQVTVGGIDSVSSEVFEAFDYVALGHIHGPQKVGRDTIRYAGSPLKYSFSEEFHKKSVTVVEMLEKGAVEVTRIPLTPLRDMRRIKGRMSDLMQDEIVNLLNPNDYLGVTLTDEDEILDPMHTLRNVYPNVMQITLQKREETKLEYGIQENKIKEKTPMELLEHFFEFAADREVDDRRRDVMKELLED